MKKNNFLIFTSSRAEYGLMKSLISEMEKNFNISLAISGTHLIKKYGKTIKDINMFKKKIFKINVLNRTTSDGISDTIASGIKKISKIFQRNKFDALIVCGDRYELLSPCIAATFHKVPIIHFHGGEITLGAYDDTVRHAVSKMSSLHFVSHEKYKKRIKQLGENSSKIHCIGAIGNNEKNFKDFYSKKEIEKKLKINFKKRNFLIVIHPETRTNSSEKILDNTLNAIKKFKNTNFYFTGIGADLYSQNIKSKIKRFVKKNDNSFYFESLGRKMYISFLKNVSCLIGNSSSAIYEAPSFKLPSVNIGSRQDGRIYGNNIINVKKILAKEIFKKIQFALKMNKEKIINPFVKKNPEKIVIKILKKEKFSKMLPKKFFDLK